MSEPCSTGPRSSTARSVPPSPLPTSFLGSDGSRRTSETTFHAPAPAGLGTFQPVRSLPLNSGAPPSSAALAAADMNRKTDRQATQRRVGLRMAVKVPATPTPRKAGAGTARRPPLALLPFFFLFGPLRRPL